MSNVIDGTIAAAKMISRDIAKSSVSRTQPSSPRTLRRRGLCCRNWEHNAIKKLGNWDVYSLANAITISALPLRQRDGLRRTAVHHVLDIDRVRRDANHFVAPVYDLAFSSHEYVFTQFQEYSLGFAWPAGETIKFQRNGRRLRRLRRLVSDLRSVRRTRSNWTRNDNVFGLRYE